MLRRPVISTQNSYEDEDQFSLGFKSNNVQKNSENGQYIFKLSSNFIQEDLIPKNKNISSQQGDQLDLQIDFGQDQNNFNDNQANDHQRQSLLQYEISQVNRIHPDLRYLITMERQAKKAMKAISSIGYLPGEQNNYKNIAMWAKSADQKISQKLQSIKWNRIELIPQQSRYYYLCPNDQNQILKKKHLDTFNNEKVEEFQLKKNLKKTGSNCQQFEQLIKSAQEYIKQYNSQIDSQLFRNKVKQSTLRQQQQTKVDLFNFLEKRKQSMIKMHQMLIEKVDEQVEEKQTIKKLNLLKQNQYKKKLRDYSEDLFQTIMPKDIFSLLPNLQSEQSYDNRIVVNSFSKFQN